MKCCEGEKEIKYWNSKGVELYWNEKEEMLAQVDQLVKKSPIPASILFSSTNIEYEVYLGFLFAPAEIGYTSIFLNKIKCLSSSGFLYIHGKGDPAGPQECELLYQFPLFLSQQVDP